MCWFNWCCVEVDLELGTAAGGGPCRIFASETGVSTVMWRDDVKTTNVEEITQ